MDNEKQNANDSIELKPEEAAEVTGGGWLNVDIGLNTTEGKGISTPVVATPLDGFPRLDEKS